jgi:hypothetical protein
MKNWQKLTEYDRPSISRGMLLRFPAAYPFEAEVVMMICEGPGSSSERCLRTITGRKAGINCYQVLPPDASPSGHFVATTWLIDNWNRWVWPDGNVEDVWIRMELTAAEL